MSYKSDSEASYCTYGCYLKRKKRISKFDFQENVKKEFIKRQGTCIWFVSNCGAQHRNKFAFKMGKYINVEVLGKCSKTFKENNDNKTKMFFNEEICERNSECETKAFAQKKYYLSFENQNCSDYITEKVFKFFKI